MTAWMLLYIGDLRVQKSEWVVDRKKIASLNASLVGIGSRNEAKSTPFLSLSLSLVSKMFNRIVLSTCCLAPPPPVKEMHD